MAAEVAEPVAAVALAVGEEPVEPFLRRQLDQVPRGRDVDVGHQDQMRGEALVLLDHREPGEVEPGELAEVDHRPVRDAVAHRREQALQLAALAGANGRDDRQRALVRHRYRANLSAKRAILSRSQKTSPRKTPGETSRISSRTLRATKEVFE